MYLNRATGPQNERNDIRHHINAQLNAQLQLGLPQLYTSYVPSETNNYDSLKKVELIDGKLVGTSTDLAAALNSVFILKTSQAAEILNGRTELPWTPSVLGALIILGKIGNYSFKAMDLDPDSDEDLASNVMRRVNSAMDFSSLQEFTAQPTTQLIKMLIKPSYNLLPYDKQHLITDLQPGMTRELTINNQQLKIKCLGASSCLLDQSYAPSQQMIVFVDGPNPQLGTVNINMDNSELDVSGFHVNLLTGAVIVDLKGPKGKQRRSGTLTMINQKSSSLSALSAAAANQVMVTARIMQAAKEAL